MESTNLKQAFAIIIFVGSEPILRIKFHVGVRYYQLIPGLCVVIRTVK